MGRAGEGQGVGTNIEREEGRGGVGGWGIGVREGGEVWEVGRGGNGPERKEVVGGFGRLEGGGGRGKR